MFLLENMHTYINTHTHSHIYIHVIYVFVNGFCDRIPLDKISQYEKVILSSMKLELLQSLIEKCGC